MNLRERLGATQGTILANVAYLSGARVAQILASFTVGILVARHLGPQGWGALAYAASFVGLFGGIAALGLDSVVVRDLVRAKADPDATADVLAAAFVLRLVASVATLALVDVAAMVADNSPETTLAIVIIAGGLLLRPLSVAELHYQARVMSKYVVGVQLAVLAITSALRVALVLLQAPPLAFAGMLLADGALLMAGLALIFQREFPHCWRWRAKRPVAARLLRDAWPLALTGALLAIYTNVDQVLVKELLGEASAGQYAVVLGIGAALNFAPMALGQSVFPSLVEARGDPAAYRRRLQLSLDVFVWGGIAVALPISLFGEELVQLLYGAQYAGSGAALAVHIWGMVATLVGILTSNWLVAEGLQGLYPVRVLASLAVCVALNFMLIPPLGIVGAAIAAVVARFMASTLFYAFDARTRILVVMQLRTLWAPVRCYRAWTARPAP